MRIHTYEVCVDANGYRAIVYECHLHVRAEFAGAEEYHQPRADGRFDGSVQYRFQVSGHSAAFQFRNNTVFNNQFERVTVPVPALTEFERRKLIGPAAALDEINDSRPALLPKVGILAFAGDVLGRAYIFKPRWMENLPARAWRISSLVLPSVVSKAR